MKLRPFQRTRSSTISAPTLLLKRSTVVLVLAGFTFIAPAAYAQKTQVQRIDELERKLEQSLKHIQELGQEVQRLRSERAAAPAPASPPAAPTAPMAPVAQAPASNLSQTVAQQSAKIQELEKQVEQIAAANSGSGLRIGSVPLHGFADVGFGHSKEANALRTGQKGFNVGTFSLYLTPEFGDRVKSLVELAFEVGSDGNVAVDLERLQLGYTFSDAATLWAGRFHTPYGYWNTAFHHGAQLQTSLSRPKFLEFEDKGGILPAHTVGAWLTGTLPGSGSRFKYDLYAGNGPLIGIDLTRPAPGGTLNPNAFTDDNHSMQVGGRFEYAPRGLLDGLKVGVHALRANVHDDSPAINRTRLFTYGPYFAFNTDAWEILGEYYKFRNRDLSGTTGTHGSNAWYTQVGYNTGRVTPYARYEKATLDQTDNYFAFLNSGRAYNTGSLGLRFDLTNSVALKFEAARSSIRNVTIFGTNNHYNEFRTQFAIRF